MTVSCSVAYSVTSVPPGGTTTFSLTSSLTTSGGTPFNPPMPSGTYSLLSGTKNGTADVTNAFYNLTSGSFDIVNSAGLAGSYMRYVTINGPNGDTICQSAPAYATFQ